MFIFGLRLASCGKEMVNAVITVGRMPAAKSVCAESLTIAPNVNLNFYCKSQNSRKSDLILAIFIVLLECVCFIY